MSGTQAVATWLGRELSGGRYRVDAQLGEGGMGTVFRAWDKNLNTDVVIKVPHAAMLQDAEFAARFAREISSLVKLSHPHIVKITDVGEHLGLPFAVMQCLPGGSLEDRQKCDSSQLIQARSASERVTREGSTADSLARASGLSADHSSTPIQALPPDSLKTWLPSIAEALDFVHGQGYIHRDVKPANILFDAHGHADLSDFGIAKSAGSRPSAPSNKTLNAEYELRSLTSPSLTSPCKTRPNTRSTVPGTFVCFGDDPQELRPQVDVGLSVAGDDELSSATRLWDHRRAAGDA